MKKIVDCDYYFASGSVKMCKEIMQKAYICFALPLRWLQIIIQKIQTYFKECGLNRTVNGKNRRCLSQLCRALAVKNEQTQIKSNINVERSTTHE